MANNLLIVESPAKSKTIEKYLGSDYQVQASFGHIRDLPKSTLGIDLEKNFEPKYVISPKSKKTLATLKKASEGKQTVYIATDLDREGEAIGWHVVQALGLNQVKGQRSKVKGPEVKRITFHEITKSALLDSLKHPRTINQDLVDAQQARRVLDRLVGYTLSPLLWRKIYKGLSAGRVQSVALRLLVEREKERQAFKSEDYFTVQASLVKKDKPRLSFKADLVSINNKKLDQLAIKTENQALEIVKELEKEKYKVTNVEKSESKRYPKPPYTTSTLQQDASNKLSYSAKRTMIIAQTLYESGLITYMRTDSVNLSNESIAQARRYLEKRFGQKYLPEKPNFYITKSKGAQEAHEAIRPTDMSLDLEKVRANLDAGQVKIYELIWKRAIASQMKPAIYNKTAVDILAGRYGFRANGSIILFDGFLKVWNSLDQETEIPELEIGEILKLIELIKEMHTTEPPARFTEARLVKTLEELGVGRPSTYAPTIDTLVARNYVEIESRQLIPTEVGFKVSDMLSENFPEIVDSEFTAQMEDDLDVIAQGKKKWQPVIKNFWGPFKKKVSEKDKTIEKINSDIPTDEICQLCGKPMVEKMGRFGRFLACTGFPECKNTKAIIVESNLVCPRDGEKLITKRTKKKKAFFGCSLYPKCDFAVWKPQDMEKKIEELEKLKEKLKFKKEALKSSQKLEVKD